jgi:hypothetical protein
VVSSGRIAVRLLENHGALHAWLHVIDAEILAVAVAHCGKPLLRVGLSRPDGSYFLTCDKTTRHGDRMAPARLVKASAAACELQRAKVKLASNHLLSLSGSPLRRSARSLESRSTLARS